MLFTIFLLIIFLLMFIVSIRAIFLAFFKKKDERSKWIVTKSMAQSFAVIVITQTLVFALKCVNADYYVYWQSNITQRIHFEPLFLCFFVLGILQIINTKKYGAPL